MLKIQVYQVPIQDETRPTIERTSELQAATLDEAILRLPAGVFTTFRTYHKLRVLRLHDHFDRLEESARLVGVEIKLDREFVRAELRQRVRAYAAEEVRVRLCIPIIEKDHPFLYIMLEQLTLPDAKDYQLGVRTITRQMQRDQPAVKWSGFIEKTSPIRKAITEGINEILMIDSQGRFLEGLSSNFFAIRGGVIYTAEGNVLAGITRKFILEIIGELGIPLVLEGYPLRELSQMEEAFISSTSRGVLPVCQINATRVGNSQPGRITCQIGEHFSQRIEQNLDFI